jgi:hypothetical protein
MPIHLDVSVPDHEAERERVLRLGGSLVEVKSFRIGDMSDTFTIMRDPEGNGFCLENLPDTERARVWTVTFASAQPRELARFWASALAWPDDGIDQSIIAQFWAAGVREPDLSRAHLLKEPNGRWPRFYFHRREKSPAELYPLHLHLVTDDRLAEIDRLTAAGASVVAAEGTDRTLTIMRDPERNPFSVGEAQIGPSCKVLVIDAACRSEPAEFPTASFRASHGDDNLSLGVSFSLVPKCFGDLTQLVAPIDDRRDLRGLDELLQNSQVLPVVPHDEHPHPLAHERRQQERLDLTSEPKPTTEVRDPDEDVRPSRRQRPSAVRE